MPAQFEQALDNGVSPAELSEIVTHLAFYSDFPNAMSAVGAARDVFARRGIGGTNSPSRLRSFCRRTSRPRRPGRRG